MTTVSMMLASLGLDAVEAWIADGIRNHLDRVLEQHGARLFRHLQAIGDIAFLEYVGATPASEPIRDAIEPILRDLEFQDLVLATWRGKPEHAALFIPIAVAVRAAGELSSDHARDAAMLARASARFTRERAPFRAAQIDHALWHLTGDGQHRTHLVGVARLGGLGPGRHLGDLGLTDDEAIARTIMGVTDFGREPWPDGLMDAAEVRRLLNIRAHRAEAAGDTVRLAMIAACRSCLGLTDDPRLAHELDVLLAARDDEGSWPGSSELAEALTRDGLADPVERRFFERLRATMAARDALRRASGRLVAAVPLSLPAPLRWRHRIARRDWLGLLRSEGRAATPARAALALGDHRVTPCAESLDDSASLLDAAEWAHWAARSDALAPHWRREIERIAADVAPHAACSSRVLRLAALVAAPVERDAIEAARRRPLDVDGATALVILAGAGTIDRAWARSAVVPLVTELLAERDVAGVATILAFGRKVLDADAIELCERFLDDVVPHSGDPRTWEWNLHMSGLATGASASCGRCSGAPIRGDFVFLEPDAGRRSARPPVGRTKS